MYGFDFAALAPLEKGWSGDRKYRAQGGMAANTCCAYRLLQSANSVRAALR